MSKRTLWTTALLLVVMAYLGSPAVGNDNLERQMLANTNLLLEQHKDLQTALDAVSKKDDNLKTALQANTDAVANLSRSMMEMSGAQKAFTSQIGAVQTDVDQQFTGARDKLDELNQRMGTLQDQMQKVQQTIQAIQAPPVQPAAPASVAAPGGMPAGTAASGGGAIPAPSNPAADQLFTTALADVQANRFRQAQTELSQFTRGYPLDPHAGDATYWLGYVFFNEKMYPDAIDQLRGFMDAFPDSAKVPDAEYYRAMSYAGRGDRSEAISELKTLIKNYPDTQIADLARKALQSLQSGGRG